MGVTYALIIAVEEYNQSTSFTKVKYAKKDAEEVAEALIGIGVNKDDIKLLINTDATNTAILYELDILIKRATEADRIIVFFAGHGTYSNEKNYIIPVDAYKTQIKGTCIAIDIIMGYLKKSLSKRNLLFLDCCHSGFEPGEAVRDDESDFLAEELMYSYKDETYCVGFASSKSHEKSISDPTLKNGVWSHFLIKALRGEADKKVY